VSRRERIVALLEHHVDLLPALVLFPWVTWLAEGMRTSRRA